MLPSVIYPGSPAFVNVGRGSDDMEKVVSAFFRWDLGKTRDKSYWQGLSRGELEKNMLIYRYSNTNSLQEINSFYQINSAKDLFIYLRSFYKKYDSEWHTKKKKISVKKNAAENTDYWILQRILVF